MGAQAAWLLHRWAEGTPATASHSSWRLLLSLGPCYQWLRLQWLVSDYPLAAGCWDDTQ